MFGGHHSEPVVFDGAPVKVDHDDMWRLSFDEGLDTNTEASQSTTRSPSARWQRICAQCILRPEARAFAPMGVIEDDAGTLRYSTVDIL